MERFDRGGQLRPQVGVDGHLQRFGTNGGLGWNLSAIAGGAGVQCHDLLGVDAMRTVHGLWKSIACLLLALASAPLCAQTVEYIHTDALGTPVAVTNAAGAVIERSEYEPYGALLNRPITDGPGFTGHVQDAATGLTYMQQRYYDPTLGIFTSVDPVAARPTGDNFCRYCYARNNPYRFTDPDGRETGAAFRAIYIADSGQSHQSQEMGESAQVVVDVAVAVAIDVAVGGPSGEGVAVFSGIRAARAADKLADAAKGAAGGVRAGKGHTRAANKLGREQNRASNAGEMKCPTCSKKMNDPVQSKKGETVDRDAAVGDHKIPKSKGGDGATVKDMRNHETKCWECNSRKSDK
jgi:RHS repeat-associated protein